jgi:TRAP-type C4-dicarboxylate transport system substrate-binding protein
MAATAVACSFALPLSRPVVAQTTWNMYITFPVATAPNVVGVQRILDGIKQASNGALTVNLHLGGSLPIKGETITQSVGDNVVIVVLPLMDLPAYLSSTIHVQVFPLTVPVPIPTNPTLLA